MSTQPDPDPRTRTQPDPDPRDLFDSEILPDLPDTPPSILQALRDTYVAGYYRALKEISGAVYAALPAAELPDRTLADTVSERPPRTGD